MKIVKAKKLKDDMVSFECPECGHTSKKKHDKDKKDQESHIGFFGSKCKGCAHLVKVMS